MAETSYWVRIDSPTANNSSINLVGSEPAFLITFVASPGGDLYLDQPSLGAIDPNTQVDIGGTLYNFSFDYVGTLPTLNNDGAGKVPLQFQGDRVLQITIVDYPIVGENSQVIILPDSNATEAEMNAFAQGAISPQNEVLTPPPLPVCFLSGTLIETPTGPVRVDDLRDGDLVMTVDDGPQPLIWVTQSDHNWPGSDDRIKPIQIKAGALGGGLPLADLIVSPQHHIFFANEQCQALFGHDAVLAPAKGLTGLPGIRQMQGKKDATYFHLMLEKHALLMAHGVPSESFYPGPNAIKMLSVTQRNTLLRLFPALRRDPEGGYGNSVRHKITRRQAESLVDRMQGRVAEQAA